MLASIIKPDGLPGEDILIFLNDEEIKELEDNPLKGKIFEYRDVRKAYSLEVRIDESEYVKVRVKREPMEDPNVYKILFCKDHYLKLKETGRLGGGPDNHSKIDILTEYATNQDEEFRNLLRKISFRWENRDRIIDKMKREGL